MDVPREAAEQFYHVEIDMGVLSPDCYVPKASATGVFEAMVTIGAMKSIRSDYASTSTGRSYRRPRSGSG